MENSAWDMPGMSQRIVLHGCCFLDGNRERSLFVIAAIISGV
jgi:hypothetical protein